MSFVKTPVTERFVRRPLVSRRLPLIPPLSVRERSRSLGAEVTDRRPAPLLRHPAFNALHRGQSCEAAGAHPSNPGVPDPNPSHRLARGRRVKILPNPHAASPFRTNGRAIYYTRAPCGNDTDPSPYRALHHTGPPLHAGYLTQQMICRDFNRLPVGLF
jgi:hypothetical protein